MRLPHLQFTVRRMMVAVSLTALMISAELTHERVVEYRYKAESHEIIELRLTEGMTESAGTLEKHLEESKHFEESKNSIINSFKSLGIPQEDYDKFLAQADRELKGIMDLEIKREQDRKAKQEQNHKEERL